MSQRQTVTYGVAKRLVELAPDVLVRPQLLVILCGYLQSLRYVGDGDQVLQFYYEVVPWWHILPCAPPNLGLPGLVGLLLRGGPLLRRCLMHPHELKSTWCSRARGNNACALLVDFSLRDNMSHRSTPNIAESLGVVPDEGFVEGSRHDPLPERVYDHGLVLGVQLHHLCPKTIEELFQGLSLILSYVEKIVRNWWGSPIAIYCSLNSLESCANDVTCRSRRLRNQSSTVPASVLMKSLQRIASEPPTNII